MSTSPVRAKWKFCGAVERGLLPAACVTVSAWFGSEVTLAGGAGTRGIPGAESYMRMHRAWRSPVV